MLKFLYAFRQDYLCLGSFSQNLGTGATSVRFYDPEVKSTAAILAGGLSAETA